VTDKKIIKLDVGDRRPVKSHRGNLHDCKHWPVIVDERLRTVECEKCGTLLDPVQVLIEIANYYREVDYRLREMREYERKTEERKQKSRERYQKKKRETE